MIKRGIKILRATFGVISNREELLSDIFFSVAYESLLTDYHRVETIPFTDDLDCYIIIHDDPQMPPRITVENDQIYVTGAIEKATRECSDLRYTLFGNEGLLFRYVMRVLEQKYNVYSYHACSLYDEKHNHMFVVPGGAGSGKTCLILKGLELGLKLFSTEMTHFLDGDEFRLSKGSLVDNVRVGNLKYSYPNVPKMLGLELPRTDEEWLKKIAVDLSPLQTAFDSISNVRITAILPHIEEDRTQCFAIDVKDRRAARKALFDNICDKISETILLYDTIPIPGFDDPDLMRRRVEAVDHFFDRTERVVKVTAGSQNCWDGILEE